MIAKIMNLNNCGISYIIPQYFSSKLQNNIKNYFAQYLMGIISFLVVYYIYYNFEFYIF
jgi:hypothetical protein